MILWTVNNPAYEAKRLAGCGLLCTASGSGRAGATASGGTQTRPPWLLTMGYDSVAGEGVTCDRAPEQCCTEQLPF